MAQQPYLTAHPIESPLKCSYKFLKLKPQMGRIARALSSAKSFIMEILSANKKTGNYIAKINKRRKRKKLLRAIAMPCNWPSSHVTPIPNSMESITYYDSTWSLAVIANDGPPEPELSGYVRWLEENQNSSEIDRLAERFIESCHEKFRLEKQESYRRYQEMLARSM